MYSVTCLLHATGGPNLISEDIIPTQWLLQMVEKILRPLYSASKDLLNTLGQITLYLRVRDRSLPMLTLMIDTLAINVLLGPTCMTSTNLNVTRDSQRYRSQP